MRLRMVLVVPLVLAAGGIFGLFWATHRGMSVTTTESTIADYADELRAIGARNPIEGPSQKNASARLAGLKADIGTVEAIAPRYRAAIGDKIVGLRFRQSCRRQDREGNPSSRVSDRECLGWAVLGNNGTIPKPHGAECGVRLGRVAWQSRNRNPRVCALRARHRDYHGECGSRL
jgi:hypothetical protein